MTDKLDRKARKTVKSWEKARHKQKMAQVRAVDARRTEAISKSHAGTSDEDSERAAFRRELERQGHWVVR